jgi:phenylalanyl-tRNA synthetase alpha chain
MLDDLFPLLRELPKEDRRDAGRLLNELKVRVQSAIEVRGVELQRQEAEARLRAARVDVTLPGRRPPVGSLHPVTRVARQIAEIFLGLGYTVAEGPEVEEDRFNFGLLNFPDDHPARDAQDTLFVAGGRLLRTHTSPVQIRTMLARQPPIRVICPGRVYRNDNDLRHSPMFHQIEGLCIGEGVTLGDLKGTLEAFLHRLFSPETGVRLRPSFFPFTEPSCEVDVTCQICRGAGCPTCSGTGWMEILGAGMVDPRVLENCGIDPDRYSGFAFGLGLDRVAMNQWGIPNIRSLFDSDERLLRQVRG